MTSASLHSNIHWLLIRASMVGKQRLIKVAEAYDLSIMQALTLCILEPNKPISMSVVSDTFSCDPSNVTGIVERLSNGGYIERRESRVDRRVKTISLTKSGTTLRSDFLNQIDETSSTHISNLTETEVTALQKLLLKMVDPPNTHKS